MGPAANAAIAATKLVRQVLVWGASLADPAAVVAGSHYFGLINIAGPRAIGFWNLVFALNELNVVQLDEVIVFGPAAN